MRYLAIILLMLTAHAAHAEWDLKKQFTGKDYTYDGKEPELCKSFVQSVLTEDGQVKIIQPDFEGHSLDQPLFKKNMPTCDTSQFTKVGRMSIPMGTPPYQRQLYPVGEETQGEEYFAYYDMKTKGFDVDFLYQGPLHNLEQENYMDRGGVALLKRPNCKRLSQGVVVGGQPMAYEDPHTLRSVELVKYKGEYWWVLVVLSTQDLERKNIGFESIYLTNVSRQRLLRTKCGAVKFYKH